MENIIELKDSKIIANIMNIAFNTVALQLNYTIENAPRFPAFINYDEIEKDFDNGLKMFGYKINGQIIGCAGYQFNNKEDKYFIKRVVTLPEHRHKGIGKKLMEYVENNIRENNGKIIEIYVVDENKILIEWYKKLNYKYVRIDDLSGIEKDGKKLFPFNSYVMNKILE